MKELQPAVLRNLVESSLDGIVILEDEWFIRYANPAACRILGRPEEEIIGHSLLEFIAEHYRERQRIQSKSDAPGLYDTVIVWPSGQERIVTYSTELLPSVHKDKSFAVVRDVTLERRAQQEARTLAAIAAKTTLARPLDELLGQLAKEVVEATRTEAAAFILKKGSGFEFAGLYGLPPGYVEADLEAGRLQPHQGLSEAVVRQQQPLVQSHFRQQCLSDPLSQPLHPFMRQVAWDTVITVPLTYQQSQLGALLVFCRPEYAIDQRQLSFFQAIADQAALAIQNAQQYERTQQRNKQLSALLEVSRDVALTLEMRPLLGQLLEKLRGVVDYSGAAIFALKSEEALELLCYRGPLPQEELIRHWDLRLAQHNRQVIRQRSPVIIPDVNADTALAAAFRATAEAQLGYVPGLIGTWMGVPLMVRDRIIGVLAFDHQQVGAYTTEQLELAQVFAQQAAAAIENAQLFEQAQGKAALEERARLARELHDSVSQALYGIALGARAALNAAEHNPQALKEPLEYILSLSEAGIAEMRALIFELRPESLAEEGLVAALARQAAAAKARYDLAVETHFCEEPEISLEAKEALYRIAQEALHNTVKHAQASQVKLRLDQAEGQVVLEVCDNGKGFDPQQEFPGHLGQRSMRERAEAIGANLNINSSPNKGVDIRVSLPLG